MAITDSTGLPLAISIAPGSRGESLLVDQTLDSAFLDELPEKLIGDKAYDSAPLARSLRAERNIELVAPLRRGSWKHRKRKQDGRPLRRYKKRWKVERLFAWLKSFRRVALRWDRKAENFLAFVHLACIVILLRQL